MLSRNLGVTLPVNLAQLLFKLEPRIGQSAIALKFNETRAFTKNTRVSFKAIPLAREKEGFKGTWCDLTRALYFLLWFSGEHSDI